MSTPGADVRVLYVDDDRDLRELVALRLEREHPALEIHTAASAADGLAHLDEKTIDCVVSDHDMPGMDGLEFLRAVRDRDEELPFILYTGKGSEEIASEAISAGVTDYLQKGTGSEQYDLLANRIEHSVSEVRARRGLEKSERRLSTLIANLPGMVYRARNERGWPMEFVSEGAVDLTGYASTAIEAGEVDWGTDVIHEDDRAEVWDRVQTALDADDPFEVTYRIRTADDEVRWVWERGRTVERDGDDCEVLEGFVTDITTRRTRERELAAEREITQTIIDALDDVFYLVTVEGEFVRWNERLETVTGYSEAEIAEMRVEDLFPSEFHETLVESTREALRTGAANFETEIVTKDGDRRRMEFRGTLVDDDGDELTGICGIARDVSDRVERERELEQYRTLVENVGDSMYVLDTDGTIEMVNRAMAERLGYPREDIVGKTASDFMPAADVEAAEEAIRDLLADDDRSWATVELQTITVDGERRQTEDQIAVLTDETGEFVGSVGVIRDITERKRREQELQRYETVIQAVGDPVYTLDDEGVITFANGAMGSLTGYGLDELAGEHVSKIMTEEDVEDGKRLITRLLQEEELSYDTFEMDLVTSDGELVPCENHVALLPLSDGTFRGTAGVIRDISERKERERRLEEFASVVSHDLRNPLNVVRGRLELAMEDGDLAHLEAAMDAADRMERLTEDLLALARQGEVVGDVESVDLASVARRAWDQIEDDRGTLTVETDGTVAADPNRLVELLENLFHNAVEHGHEGDAAVTIRVGSNEDGFYVEDDGRGIDPDLRESVFERGHTTSEDGTGFGLAIVEEIVTAHGWSIRVREGRDGGARFEIDV